MVKIWKILILGRIVAGNINSDENVKYIENKDEHVLLNGLGGPLQRLRFEYL